MRRAALLTALVTATSATAADTLLPSLAGRYYQRFPNALVSGEKYTGENIVEIVPISRNAAYVRVHLDHYNGHSCGIYGIAKVEGDALVYHDVHLASARSDNRKCALTLRRVDQSLSIDDGEGSCAGYCGMRGTLSKITLPYASKRPIRYMARLKASYQFEAALYEWRNGKPYEPWKQSVPASTDPGPHAPMK